MWCKITPVDDRSAPKRILLMMLLPIGDTLFTTPSMRALRRRYPEAEITAVVYPTNRGVLSNNPDIDRFLLWPTRHRWAGMRDILKLFWNLRRSRFDLAVEFSNYNWWVSWLSGIPRRTEMNLPRLWWVLPWAGQEWRKQHAVEHYADPVRRLGIPVDDMALRIFPGKQEEAKARAWLERYKVEPGELLVGIHPGGEGLWGRKRWSVARFAEVADGLSEGVGARIVIMGGKDDAPAAAEISSRTRASVINATGQTTLGETAALVRHCALFIGNDSSPLHIAAASGTPVVGIYGPTDPRSYHPWIPGGEEGADYAIVRSDLPCACKFPLVGGTTIAGFFTCLSCPALETITPQQVLEAAMRILEGKR